MVRLNVARRAAGGMQLVRAVGGTFLLRAVGGMLVMGSLAVAAAPLVWHSFGETALLPRDLPAPRGDIPAPEPVNTASIIALAPFGATVPEQGRPAAAQETTLELTLQGVLLDRDPARSVALIRVEGTAAAYLPGDTITTAATLLEVAEAQVLIDVNGQRQTLSFPGPEARSAPATTAAQSGLDRLRALALGSSSAAAAPQPRTTDDYIDMWRERIKRNPGQVLTDIGLIASENGYIIADKHDIGVRRAGLKPGDLVTSVNGRQVGDVERDRKLYDEIAASGNARIEVQRDGRSIVMSFPLR
ncbi:type II secretion system protein N [Sulfitobacter sabulilitoris]|nr:type II secretion system protein N [Sulfitobacter sabulilitoris]